MSTLCCRPLCAADVPAVAAIEAAVYDGWSADNIAAVQTAPAARAFVGCIAEQVVAFAAFTLVADEANLDALSVDASQRRQGAATVLLTHAFSALHAEGAASVFLEVRSQNKPALALYEQMGFTTCGLRKHFYEKPPDDAVLMTKLLG